MVESESHVVRLRVELSELVPEGMGVIRVERDDETLLVVRPNEPLTPALTAEINRHLTHARANVIGGDPSQSGESARPHPTTHY